MAPAGLPPATNPNSVSNGGNLVDYAHSLWMAARIEQGTAFTMMQTPNSPNADCDDSPPTDGLVTSRSRHPGGVNALFVDGSVHFIKSTVAPLTWYALGTKANGEVLSSDRY